MESVTDHGEIKLDITSDEALELWDEMIEGISEETSDQDQPQILTYSAFGHLLAYLAKALRSSESDPPPSSAGPATGS